MLTIVCFALLIIGSQGIQPYNATSNKEFDFYKDYNTFPLPVCSLVDKELPFTVKVQEGIQLAFYPSSGGRVICDGEKAQLHSIIFAFHPEGHPEIQIRLKYKESEESREWVLESKMFLTPETDADWSLAKKSAVFLDSQCDDFTAELFKRREESKTRKTTLKLMWLESVLVKEPPRFRCFGAQGPWARLWYVALPVIFTPELYNTLKQVREELTNEKIF